MMFAAQAVMSGTQDIVLASGIESMTRVPMGSVATLFIKEGLGHYKSERLEEKYPGIMFSQFMGAEMIVKKHGFTKDDLTPMRSKATAARKRRPRRGISSARSSGSTSIPPMAARRIWSTKASASMRRSKASRA
jgi:acetyl-CoA acetyltransferase